MTRPRFVLDASVALAFCFDDERDADVDGVLQFLAVNKAFVPAIWPLEVANALLTAERRKRIDGVACANAIAILNDMAIEVDHDASGLVPSSVLSVARAQGLSAYDASYLELAMRKGLPLASRDATLLKAAKKCGVAKFKPK